jgi:hypothetical protein
MRSAALVGAKRLRDVFGGLDKTAEYDWLVTSIETRRDDTDGAGELCIGFALEIVSDARHLLKAEW